jgi:hypothetical protein
MLRKFLVTGFPLVVRLFSVGSNLESVWGTIFMVGVMLFIADVDPYMKREDRMLALPTHMQLVVTMLAGMGESVIEAGDSGTDRQAAHDFIAVVVIGTALPIVVVLCWLIVDPHCRTWISQWVADKWKYCFRSTRKVVIHKLKPKLTPVLGRFGLVWADMLPILTEVDSVEELLEAVENPEAFIVRLTEASTTAAKKMAVVRLKAAFEPYLSAQGLEWADIVPVLELVGSIEHQDAISDPAAFLVSVANSGGRAAAELTRIRQEHQDIARTSTRRHRVNPVAPEDS